MTHLQKARKGFTKGSTTYKCLCCTRLTRSIGNGDNENVRLCVECWDMAGIENGLQDGIYPVVAEEESEWTRDMAEAEWVRLHAACVAKGGVLPAMI